MSNTGENAKLIERLRIGAQHEVADALAAADARIAELEATVIDDALAIGRSANACMDMMNQRDEARTRAETTETLLEEARRALGPFAEDLENWTDENGWTHEAPINDRICDWFGPSDFRRARATLDRIGK